MWIAGGGEKVTLKIAAQYADYTNFDGTPEGFDHKSEILKGHCDDLGRDFGDDRALGQLQRRHRRDRGRRRGPARSSTASCCARAASPTTRRPRVEDLRKQPAVGTPDKIVSMLKDMEARGMTYAITYFAEAAYDRSGIELFEQTVAPELKG